MLNVYPDSIGEKFSDTIAMLKMAEFKEVFSLKEAKALLIMGAFFYIGLNIWQFNASIFLTVV